MGCATLSRETETVQALHAGDPQCLESLYAAHWGPLVRYADGILGGDGNAEDAVQEAFIRLWSHRREVYHGGSLRAFLHTLTRNAAIDERRRSARRGAVPVTGEPWSSPCPLAAAAASELARAAQAAVAALPPRRREVFVLARFKGRTYREIAASMGVSEQTVANQLSAALRSLRRTLAVFRDGQSRPWQGPHLGRRPPAKGASTARDGVRPGIAMWGHTARASLGPTTPTAPRSRWFELTAHSERPAPLESPEA